MAEEKRPLMATQESPENRKSKMAPEQQRKSAVEKHRGVMTRQPPGHSQRLEQQQHKRWSWGGGNAAEPGDKRAVFTSHAKLQHGSGVSKHLSSSSATLVGSFERASVHEPMRSCSGDRQKASPAAGESGSEQQKERCLSSPRSRRPALPSIVPHSMSLITKATLGTQKQPPSSAPLRQVSRHRPPSPSTAKQQSASLQPNSRPPPSQRPTLMPTGPPALRKREPKPKDSLGQLPPPQCSDGLGGNRTKDESSLRLTVGSTSAEEAARILSENRRLAREQKERGEQLRIQKEEERLREEQERRLAEEEEETQAKEKRKEEEELAQDQRRQREAEIQREYKEAEARASEVAEKRRQERERNQQERMQRKKRIEEIMKRTRKTDTSDSKREKGVLHENEEDCQATEEDLKETRDVRNDGLSQLEQDQPVCSGKTVFQEDLTAISSSLGSQLVGHSDPDSTSLPTQKCGVSPWDLEGPVDKGVHPNTWPVTGGEAPPKNTQDTETQL